MTRIRVCNQNVEVPQVCDTYTFEHISATSLRHFYVFAIKTFKWHKSVTLIRVERISVTSLWHLYVVAIKPIKCDKSVTRIRFERISVTSL